MGWIDTLRKAEKEGIGVAHRGFDRARTSWEDAERRLRRKMRVFPGQRRKPAPVAAPPVADLEMIGDETPPLAGQHKDRAA